MNLSREVLKNIEDNFTGNKIIREYLDHYNIHLNHVEFDKSEINTALQRLYSDLKKKYVYNYLDSMADFNCCNGTSKYYNNLKKEYIYCNDNILNDTQVAVEFKWNFDGEKYSDKSVQIYFNFDNSVELDTVGKVQAIMQKTKDFLYNWDKIEADLNRDMEKYVSKILAEDKRLEAEKQKIIAKTELEDTEFIDFCRNFKI